MPARLRSNTPTPSTHRRVICAAAATLAGATALAIALPAPSAGAATPAFGAVAGATSATLDTTFLQGSGPDGSALASVQGVFGQSLASFDPKVTPQAKGEALGFLGSATSNGTETQLAGVGAGQSAPPANPDPVSGSAKAVSVDFPGGGTLFDASAVKYTASARPVSTAAGVVASGTTAGGSFDTLPEMPDPSTVPPTQAQAVAKAAATIAAAVAKADPKAGAAAPAAVQLGGFFPSASGAKTSSSVAVAKIGSSPASVATATAQAATFSAGGFTFVIPAGSLTTTATGTVGTSKVTYAAPAITYSGPNVAAGTALPAAGVTLTEPNLSVTVLPGALKQTNTGTSVTAGVALLTASITITDAGTTLLSSTAAIGTLTAASFAPTVVAPPSTTAPSPLPTPSGPELANTGASTHGLPLTGSVLVIAGVGVLFLVRRRRPSAGAHSHPSA